MAIRSFEWQERDGLSLPMGPRNCRQEVRVEDCHACAYEICESGEGDALAVQRGQVFTLNRSEHGVLLLMGEGPRVNQLIQVSRFRLGWRRSSMVYRVRWTRPLRVSSQDELFLVGCSLITGVPR